MIQSFQIIEQIVWNPYLLTIVGIGWICIIANHFKLQWRIRNHVDYWKTCKNASNEEIQKWYEDHRTSEYASKLNPEWDKAITREFLKRGFIPIWTKSQGGNQESKN